MNVPCCLRNAAEHTLSCYRDVWAVPLLVSETDVSQVTKGIYGAQSGSAKNKGHQDKGHTKTMETPKQWKHQYKWHTKTRDTPKQKFTKFTKIYKIYKYLKKHTKLFKIP